MKLKPQKPASPHRLRKAAYKHKRESKCKKLKPSMVLSEAPERKLPQDTTLTAAEEPKKASKEKCPMG